jgi:hypothetical protein
MKGKSFFFVPLLITLSLGSYGQTRAKDFTGTWTYYAPYAPYGYQNGTIIVGSQGNQPSVALSFEKSDARISAENVKVSGDSLKFSVIVQEDSVDVLLKLRSDTIMTGKAISTSGETDISAKRNPKQQK